MENIFLKLFSERKSENTVQLSTVVRRVSAYWSKRSSTNYKIPAHAFSILVLAHTHTLAISASRKDVICQRSSCCLPEVLRGSSISFGSNALFVDKSKLMTGKREAFGGKILLTLLRLNLTTEQDTSSCRNDRFL